MGTGLYIDVKMEVVHLPKICRTACAVDKFLDEFEGNEKEMKSLFYVWYTTIELEYKNLERCLGVVKKGTTQF